MTLEWSWIKNGRANLPDSKTGAKTLYLCAKAEEILSKCKRKPKGKHRRFIFSGKSNKKPIPCINASWKIIRKAADIEDVRLHDLRHSYASFALYAPKHARY